MNPRSFLNLSPSSLIRTSLLTVLLLAGCVPADAPAPAQTEAPAQPAAPMTETPQSAPADEAPAPATEMPAMTEVVTTMPEFVPKGPDLEATDPATVSLASGDLQLVEFFRFT